MSTIVLNSKCIGTSIQLLYLDYSTSTLQDQIESFALSKIAKEVRHEPAAMLKQGIRRNFFGLAQENFYAVLSTRNALVTIKMKQEDEINKELLVN